MKRAWTILVMLAAFGILFIGSCKSKQATEETQKQQQEQPSSRTFTAVPEELESAPSSVGGTSEEGQASASSFAKGTQSEEQPASEKEAEAATNIEATESIASPEAQPPATPLKKPIQVKKLAPQRIIKEKKTEEENK